MQGNFDFEEGLKSQDRQSHLPRHWHCHVSQKQPEAEHGQAMTGESSPRTLARRAAFLSERRGRSAEAMRPPILFHLCVGTQQ